MLKSKIEFFEDKLKEKQKVVDDMSKQLHHSQEQAQDLAKRVVENAAPFKETSNRDATKEGNKLGA